MKKVKDLYSATASSPLEMAMLYNCRVGFVVPEYQRQYDWPVESVERLCSDILNGFHRLSSSTDANAFTFLGAVILVQEGTKEEEFSGESLAIVDGQQRLTTLTLIACALCELLRVETSKAEIESDDTDFARWLKKEVDDRLQALFVCSNGAQHVKPTQTFPFPRIVRSGDQRGKSAAKSDYRSAIGKFLDGFSKYFQEEKLEYEVPNLGKEVDSEKLSRNFEAIRSLVRNLSLEEWYEETECELFPIEAVRYAQCRSLFECLPDFFSSEEERQKVIEKIINSEKLNALARALLFSSYFCNCVVLTQVTTEDESAAFDIFDALNTTGEPLTAIETLKPRVIHFENGISGYQGSDSELHFERISKEIEKRFLDTKQKQNETKNLIVTFALYLGGEKLSRDLAAQRNFLRTSYNAAVKKGQTSARAFVCSLANVVEFRARYWERDGIEELGRFHSSANLDQVQLLVSLISDMNTSLAIPVLARYWSPDLKSAGESNFVEVLRAIAAFLILRRSATGGTSGIDSDFRSIMAPPKGKGASRKFGLCSGVDHENPVLTPSDLKNALRTLLEYKLKALDKDSWVKCVVANPLYQQSRVVVRFMLLSAGHQAVPSVSVSGGWDKKGVKVSFNDSDFLSYRTWTSKNYATVEHVAPATTPQFGWDADLYEDNILRHSVGNLALLPAEENCAIGNGGWVKKKKFYMAVTEVLVADQKQRIEEAKVSGVQFGKSTEKLLQEGQRLSLLDPLRDVSDWDSEVVVKRGRNIAAHTWDMVWPWLN